MNDSDRYIKIVEWSQEDDCFIGRSPGLFIGGCHGDDQREVFDELCRIVDEVVADLRSEGEPLPPATAGRRLIDTVAA